MLKNTVILNPEWGTAAVYKVLDTPEVLEDQGRFSRDQLDTIWSDDEYAEMRDQLLQLMMRFKLCYEIPGRPHHYIAPQLLDIDKPQYDWNGDQNLLLRYKYGFMPKGILTRFIVEMHKYIEGQRLVWKTGVVLTNNAARAEVIELYYKGEIHIRVSGVRSKELLTVILHEIDKINDSYDRIRVDKQIPCNCKICEASDLPHFFALDTLHRFLDRGKTTAECQSSGDPVAINPIIFGVSDTLLEVSYDAPHRVLPLNRPKPTVQGITKIPPTVKEQWPIQTLTETPITKEVFISYAWGGDSEEMANKIDQTFATTDITLIRDKRNLGFKGRIKAFMEQIGQGNAVIVVISDKYLKSENCMFELVEIAANGDFYDRIFPIVLPDAQIYKPVQRIRYIQHWEQEIAELDEAMKSVSSANLQGFRESIDQYTRIRNTIAELVEILKDMNTLTPDLHSDSGFAALLAAVQKRLNP